MELLMTGIGGLLIILTWTLLLKKSILDDHRDRLFDLRDHLRTTFIRNGWQLDAPVYRKLRDLINGYLRFTERYSFSEFTVVEAGVKKNAELQAALKMSFDKHFEVKCTEQQEFIKGFRRRALQVVTSYMIVSSGPLVVATLVLMPMVAIASIAKGICEALRVGGVSLLDKAIAVRELFVALINLTIALVASKVLFEEFIEEYSYTKRFRRAAAHALA